MPERVRGEGVPLWLAMGLLGLGAVFMSQAVRGFAAPPQRVAAAAEVVAQVPPVAEPSPVPPPAPRPEPAAPPPPPADCLAPVSIAFRVGAVAPLTPAASLGPVADYLARHPEARVAVEGHADGRGSEGENLVLSHRRARRVARLLEERGVATARIEVRGFGEYAPRGADALDASNRRVQVDVRGAAGCEEGGE